MTIVRQSVHFSGRSNIIAEYGTYIILPSSVISKWSSPRTVSRPDRPVLFSVMLRLRKTFFPTKSLKAVLSECISLSPVDEVRRSTHIRTDCERRQDGSDLRPDLAYPTSVPAIVSMCSVPACDSSFSRPAFSCRSCGCGRILGSRIWHPGYGAGSAMSKGKR
jgi:hypothetical protein